MQLQPIQKPAEPEYPSRHQVFAAIGKWMRRTAGVALAASALAFGGCYGASPFERDDPPDDPGDPTEPGVIVDMPELPGPFERPIIHEAGVMMAPSFECSATQPDPPEYLESWGYFEGGLCGEETGWAFHEVTEEALYRVSIDYGAELFSLSLLGPDGAELALLDAEAPAAELTLTPGLYVLATTALDPVDHPSDWITVSITPLWD